MSAKGGITEGKSHKEGGIPMVVKSTGQHVELEGGEGVINKRNMSSEKTFEFEGKEKTICEIASDINSADGNGVQIDCDNVTGKKYKYKSGGNILSEEEEADFDAWFEDGNVEEVEDGVYATQDYQWNNRIKGKEALKKFYAKEYLNRRYENGGEVKTTYVHKYNPNITLEVIEYTNKGVKGLQRNPKSLSKKEKKEGIIVNYSDSELKELFERKYANGGDVDDLKVGDFVTEYKKDTRYASGYFVGKVVGKIIMIWEQMAKVDFPPYETGKDYFIPLRELRKVSEKYQSGGSVEDYKSLIGKYVNIYSMGVSLPTQNKIQDVMVSDERFRYRDITLKFDIGNAIIPLNEADLFMNNKIIIVKDSKEEYGIQLIPNQFAKGGRMSSALKLSDYETAQMSAGGYEEQMIVPQSTTGMYKEGGKVVVFAENEEGYYRKISEHDTMRGAKTKMKNLLDTEEYYGVGVVPIDEWEKRYAPYPFKEGGDVPKASKMFHLPLELAVYVPSTQDVDKVISESELEARVDEVSKYLATTFGGFTKSERVGGFMTSQSELVTEDVVPVVSFATKSDYEAKIGRAHV
jgi:hypothetical protein